MLRLLLSPAALRQAADAVRRGPYVEGAATSRPWLGLLAFLALGGAFLIVFMVAAGAVISLASGSGVGCSTPP